MPAQVRPARPEDLAECVELFEESVSDLRQRHNLAAPAKPTSAARRMAFYEHVLNTGAFHVAQVDGRLAAFACAIFRDHLWFLSGFWARPQMQGQHIGAAVLRSVWEAGRKAGTTHFYVWASLDLPAMAAYMKMGMLPGCQILSFEGTPNLLKTPPSGTTVKPLNRAFAMALDQTVLGTRRKADHDYLADSGWQRRQVMQDGRRVGYFYLNGGMIGPAAWTEPRFGGSVLTLAFREAAAMEETISMSVPGMNHCALRFAFDAGLKLTSYSHLLMSAPFGHLEQYVPSGPAVF